MLHGRLRDILRLLMAAEAPVTSSFFAAQLNVTTRTVRNDIKELQGVLSGHGAFVQSVRGSGYSSALMTSKYSEHCCKMNFSKKGPAGIAGGENGLSYETSAAGGPLSQAR